MGCLAFKGSSTHVAVVHPLNTEPDSTNRQQDLTKDSVHSIKPENSGSNGKDVDGNGKDIDGNSKDIDGNSKDIDGNRKDSDGIDIKTKKAEQTENMQQETDEKSLDVTPVIKTVSEINNVEKEKDKDIAGSSQSPSLKHAEAENDNDDTEDNSQKQADESNKKEKKKLTEEEINELWKASLEKLREHIEYIKDESNKQINEDGDYAVKYRNAIFYIFKSYFALKEAPIAVSKKYKREVNKVLASSGAITVLCDIVLYILTSGYRYETGQVIDSRLKPFSNATGMLINFSDGDPEDAYLIADHPQLLQIFGQKLTELYQSTVDGSSDKLKQLDMVVVKKILSILHNVGMAEGNEQKLHSQNYVQILKPCLDSSDDVVRLTSLAILADIVNEEESEILKANPEVLKFLIKFLEKAIGMKNRRHCGWSVTELCRTIRRIARNDANKKALVEHGSAELLVKVAAGHHEEEHIEAVGGLRTLSFDKSNQQFFISNTEVGVIETFIRLRYSPEKEIRKACEGALWTMRDVLKTHEKYKDAVKNIVTADQMKHSEASQGHVMISYQWGNQQTIIRIKDMLKANGYKVWMDIEDMAGSTLHAMANAVESASIVLLCFSQKYKDSDNCRAEAEYAFQLKKKIIPLKMESNYRADGWLGFIIGTKLYYDFGGKYSFDSRMEGLLRELHSKLVGDLDTPDHLDLTMPKVPVTEVHDEPIIVPKKEQTKSMAPVPTDTDVVKRWTNDQVIQWLDKHTLDRNKFSKLTGIEIAFLQVVRIESPDFFYKSLTEMLKISDLLTLSKFVFALEDTKI